MNSVLDGYIRELARLVRIVVNGDVVEYCAVLTFVAFCSQLYV
jgi:hypothetical protein